MSESQHINFAPYYPATAKWGKSVIVEYYIQDPATHEMVRKQVKCNRLIKHYSTKRDKQAAVADIVQTINTKLASGWNPFITSDNARTYTKLTEVADMFLAEKAKELRPDTMRSYCSFVNTLVAAITKVERGIYCSSITKLHAVRFLDTLYIQRKLSPRSYNNYLKFGRCFFSWCVEKTYCEENPFANIKPKKRTEKKRILIPSETRKQITDYLSKQDPNFIVVLKLIYTSLMRPKEIQQLRISDVHLSEKHIVVRSDVAKNHHMRFASINQSIIDGLINMNIEKYPANYYLFSDGNKPGKNPIVKSRWRKDWDKMRTVLGLPKEMQMYSFRDTGITDMIKAGIDQLTVMQHADHSSLDMTTIYARHADPHLADIIYSKTPEF